MPFAPVSEYQILLAPFDALLQGVEDPPGSGRYPEPRWFGMIQHDTVLFDHGNPVHH